MSLKWLYCVLVVIVLNKICLSTADKPRTVGDNGDRRLILVISLDGFSHRYIQNFTLENLSRVYARGSSPESFRNQFVTKTYPNHFTVATGVYEEVHGVIANTVLDPVSKQKLGIEDEGFFTQNPEIYPIWTLNEANGGHSGCIMWPGCSATYHGRNLTFYDPYKPKKDLKESISLAFQWFNNAETPANLVFLYHEQPDASGHAYGPESPKILEELLKIDRAIGFLFQLVTLNNLQEHLDIIILSDHGMSSIPEANIIDLSTIVDSSLYTFTGNSPVLNVWPDNEHQIDVYLKLVDGEKKYNYSVFRKEAIPEEWHYKKNNRVSPILLIADEGYVFQDFHDVIDYYKNGNWPDLTDVHGDHGYPAYVHSMEPIFVALGPSFKRRFQAPPFSNVDVYPLLCHLLSISPGPTNGTLENISAILAVPISSLIQPLLIALGCLVGLIGAIGIVACVLSKRDSGRRVSADALINGYVHRKTMRSGSSMTGGDMSEEEGLLESEVVTIDL
ncbi:bis(5'-adenosyl)-triphosphatase enpp4-like isoform X1 [Palaemon carinicauda]|uniref:bis(5'-adenosyl)-triphosphatase enpp4-like isoform X1 n=1 Tax=Palaemon carinicauda TaxID=392227 RepID=UPI0035B65163